MDLDRLAEHFRDEATPLVRSDYTDEAAWATTLAAVTQEVDLGYRDEDDDPEEPPAGYSPNVPPVQSPLFDGLTAEGLAAAYGQGREPGYVLLADARTMAEARTGADPTVVYVDLSVTEEDAAELGDEPGRSFRCVASEVASVEVNLSLANLDFADFADAADSRDGVYRGSEA